MRGRPLTAEQVETVKATYAETRNYTAAGRAAGVSHQTAREYILAAADDVDDIRRAKQTEHIARLAEVRQLYLDHLADPAVRAATNARDAGVVYAILTDKQQLLSGEPTERLEHRDSPADRIAGRMDELAARRRTKTLAEESQTG